MKNNIEHAKIKRILVVVLDNLGDAVMATSVLKPLKRVCPQASIGLWVKKYCSDLFVDQSFIDTVHACDPFWDKSPGLSRGEWLKFKRTLKEIKKERYDVAIILNSEWRRALAVRWAGVPVRVGFDRRGSRFFLSDPYPHPDGENHFVDEHLSLIQQWSGYRFHRDDCTPRLEPTRSEKSLWSTWSNLTGWKRKTFVAVHPFTGDEEKTWPLSCWIDLIQSLITKYKDLRFLLISGPGEAGKIHQLTAAFHGNCIQVLTGDSLKKLKALVGQSKFLVGGDSGPGHVASALGVPVLSLFGKSNPDRSKPLGHASVHIIHKNPLMDLGVSEVEQAVTALLRVKHSHG